MSKTTRAYYKGLGRSTVWLQNHSVFNGSNSKFYFDLLIEIAPNYFLNTFLDFLQNNRNFWILFLNAVKKAIKSSLLKKTNFLGQNRVHEVCSSILDSLRVDGVHRREIISTGGKK